MAAEQAERSAEQLYIASQWRLMWWRLRRHRVAMLAALVLAGFYLIAIAAEFFAYADPMASDAKFGSMPPQGIHGFDGWRFRPYVHPVKGVRDLKTFKRVYMPDTSKKIPIRFFAHGYPYKFLGLIPTDRHLIGVQEGKAEGTIFLLGTDVQGRDLWSRLMIATRISMSIGLISVALSLILGILLGGISGFYGGWIDNVIQRVIEILRSIPTIPL